MINIPLDRLPSKLVVKEQLSPQIRVMLNRCSESLARRQWAVAERYAANAKESSQRISGRPVDYALALLHLSDVYRSSLRLGPALDYDQEAQLTLDKLPGPPHYHNRAAANYALGLTYHALGSDAEAFEWYDRARDLFERAIRYWAWESSKDSLKHQKQCEQAIQWIEELIRALEKWADALREEPLCASVWVPVFRTGVGWDTKEPRLFCLSATLRRKGGTLRFGDRVYRLLRPQLRDTRREGRAIRIGDGLYTFLPPGQNVPDLLIDFRTPHFALEVGLEPPFEIVPIKPPEDKRQEPEEERPAETVPEPGDIILVQWQCAGIGEITQATEVGEGDFQVGPFTRDHAGRVRLFVEEKRHLIGEERSIGKVVALLRPVEE
ncbi:MAG TPA: tetratricopeptide repeat protein [Thermoflexia bacterium]|jgi:tetratricopeptide (TPR) repeat protein|nr:tetratricopeptide repeat protein [Thermoflexia bacterium]